MTPNRGDALSVLGLARELARLHGAAAAGPARGAASRRAIADASPVALEAPAACPRFAGRVIRGVDNTGADAAVAARAPAARRPAQPSVRSSMSRTT